MLMRLKLLPLSAAIMLSALLTPVFSVVSVRAAPDTAAFVENLTYTAFATLGNPNITEQERFAKFSDLLHRPRGYAAHRTVCAGGQLAAG